MSLTYKLITKIMAERLKKVVPELVDIQQAGSIKGRSIINNNLGLRLGNDWAKISGQQCLFLKLDFVKAYDRLDQNFLLQVLNQMGFSHDSLSIFRGLSTKGKAKVHLNQEFTQAFDIGRGVRQGCPLAPYLFSLSTQPLIDMLNQKVKDNQLLGLQLPSKKQIDKNSFDITMETLKLFELAAGAKLNLHKTTIIPIGDGDIPAWVNESGCLVATLTDRF
ncbi:hypothetical protein R1sor_020040 [Riccia sorocarpa]|uniref:Reverse transcriptase domain-containing protein n=1 Tax=Riccia sorocarpa TaxID=122646 RepID=A0ABD3IEB5_9MARC